MPARGSTFRKTGKTKDRLFEVWHRQAADGREWTFEEFKAFARLNSWTPGKVFTRRDRNAPWSAANTVLGDHGLRQINPTRRMNKNNSTGHKGVSVCTRDGLYSAELTVHGKRVHRSSHSSLEEAIKARRSAERKYHAPILEAL